MSSKKIITLLLMITLLLLSACGSKDENTAGNKVRDLDFTIVTPNEMQQEIKDLVEERQQDPFKLTYSDGQYLYIVVGYGEQKTGGYSITVDELYLGETGIYIATTLIGPAKDDVVDEVASYPYIVIKLENMDKVVIFN